MKSFLTVLVWAVFLPPAFLQAQDGDLPIQPSFTSTFSASYSFSAQAKETGDLEHWNSAQGVSLGFFGRWGQALTLQGELNADFSSGFLRADDLLSQVFLTWNAGDSLVATLGKQRLLWGTARVFPSLDRLEPLADPAAVKKTAAGVAGVRLEYLPNEWISVQALGLPAEKLVDSRGALRVDFLIWDMDLALGLVNYRGHRWKENASGLPLAEDTPQAAGYGELSWFGSLFGVYLDAQVRTSRDRDFYLFSPGDPSALPVISTFADGPWVNVTAGFQTELPLWNRESATFLGEYHFQGDGWDGEEMDSIKPLLSFQQGGGLISIPSVGTLRRHYVYSGLSGIPLWGGAAGSVSLIAGPESGFWLTAVSLDWRLDSALTFTASFRQAGQWLEENSQAGDLLLLPWRSQLSLGLTGNF